MKKILIICFSLLISPLFGQEKKNLPKKKNNQLKINILPFLGGGYERFINEKLSVSANFNSYNAAQVLFTNRSRESFNTWLDFKWHPSKFAFIGPYLKYRRDRKRFLGSPLSEDRNSLDGSGIESKNVSAGIIIGAEQKIFKNLFYSADIGSGYRKLLKEQVLDSFGSLEEVKAVLKHEDISFEIRFRLQLGYRF